MENVAGVHDEIDVLGEDVGDRGLEAVFDVDRALVPPRFRIGLPMGGVAKVRIRQMRNSESWSRGVVESRRSFVLLDFSTPRLLAFNRGHSRVRALTINF